MENSKEMKRISKDQAKAIINNIIACLPADLKENAMDILTCRFLAQNNVIETSQILGLSANTVIKTLQAVKEITKGKNPLQLA